MDNREVEVILLKKVKELKPALHIYPSIDFKHIRSLRLPRCVSTTISNSPLAIYTVKGENGNIEQIETREHTIQFTFALDKNTSFKDVLDVKNGLGHIRGARYWLARKGVDLVIQEIGRINNISQHTADGYIERYSIDIRVTSIDKHVQHIDLVNKAKLEVVNE